MNEASAREDSVAAALLVDGDAFREDVPSGDEEAIDDGGRGSTSAGGGGAEARGAGSDRRRILLAGAGALALLVLVVALSFGLSSQSGGGGDGPATGGTSEGTLGGAGTTTGLPGDGADAPPEGGEASSAPSARPSASPSEPPTASPTTPPPSLSPSALPSLTPSVVPSSSPSGMPSAGPSERPSEEPSISPTAPPSSAPSETRSPTRAPTPRPTTDPTASPSARPTNRPFDFSQWTWIDWDDPEPSASSAAEGSIETPYFFGSEFYADDDLGIHVSTGLTVKPIARAGEKVRYGDGGKSKSKYHADTDAAGIVPMDPNDPLGGGYVYVANSETNGGEGGVYGLYFDRDGDVLEYKELLTGTTRNCGGGHTPWNTWVSCEEYSNGQCHEIDPINLRTNRTVLGGRRGGRYESVACDDRDPANLVFFTTEDQARGALRRFEAVGFGWGALHEGGVTTFLRVLDERRYEWTANETAAKRSAELYYPLSEGIQFHEGRLYFLSKKEKKMLVLDLEDMTYETELTGKKMYGEGDFGSQPDQNFFGPTRKYLYFTEDGGNDPGLYARYGEDGTYFALFQAIPGGIFSGDETVGIALSPDHKILYAGFQEYGIIFEVKRDDGLAFE